ncbi:class I SAM-dependent methyltransferase [Phytoactinopolyspora mesophila]|uniref:Methyltransferase domain-containing protein n=1 Tax=Phytoactinopolyspora mesophila TaxID=2650750 RepID=A0A7K3LYH7_9ACTN|nr:class I SAM-dependent methyltransferase [Phytoactinopolyspora mesophila]NDL55732.1 methyltransferase domain-containing protein [Phytoactinopolyspora mesophila]
MQSISRRIDAAVALLNPQPDEELLEIGCGTGQAILAATMRAPGARITAIDRSEKAVARARVVNQAAINAGRVRISTRDIEKQPVSPGSFDRAFSIRVNTFWTRPGVALPHVAASLHAGGQLWMIYDGPAEKVVDPIVASLDAYGIQDIRTETTEGAYAIIASFPPGIDHAPASR